MANPIDLTPAKKDAKPTKLNLKYMRDRDREMVKGKFIFHEVPGGCMMFSFRKYKEDPVENFNLVDGEIYTLPLGVATHLNTNCWYPEYGFIATEQKTASGYAPSISGNPGQTMRISKKIRRCSFQSLEFTDIEGLSTKPDIIQVENV